MGLVEEANLQTVWAAYVNKGIPRLLVDIGYSWGVLQSGQVIETRSILPQQWLWFEMRKFKHIAA